MDETVLFVVKLRRSPCWLHSFDSMCVFTFTGTLGHTWWAWSTLRLSQSLRTRRNTPGELSTPWSRGSAPTLETSPKEPFLCLLIRNSTPALMTPKIPHKYSICFVYPSLRHASRANCVLEWGERGNRSSVSVSSDLTWCHGFVIYQKLLSTFTLNSSSVFSGVQT